MAKLEKLFNDCTLTDLDKSFGLRWTRPLQTLDDLLTSAQSIVLSDYETMACLNLSKLLDLNVLYWLEQDLSLHFIGPMFSLVNFTEPYRFNLFAQRPIQATLNTVQGESILLSGKPDEILASGYTSPLYTIPVSSIS